MNGIEYQMAAMRTNDGRNRDRLLNAVSTTNGIDVANYAMFRYMWPQSGEYFKHTDSDESAGIVGMSVNEMEKYK